MMSFLRFMLLTLFVLFITLNMQKAEVNAGPLSLNFARSFRSGREIRAPFKTSDIMVARGFGKRNSQPLLETSKANTATTPIINDIEKTADLAGNSFITTTGENFDTVGTKMDLFASELATNPNLARWILHRFVDINGNGKFTSQELVPYALENFEYY